MKLIWLIIAIAFGIAEAMTPSLTLIWFSIGALVVLFLSSFIESIFIQIVLFAIISTALLFIATKKIVKKDESYKYNTNLQAIISKRGTVESEILPGQTGLVVVDSEKWSAISIDGRKLEKGDIVEVVKIEGVKLVVKKIKKINIVGV
ncbi:NfeD family protein [Faecalimicrobium sp. JNUCC 81]